MKDISLFRCCEKAFLCVAAKFNKYVWVSFNKYSIQFETNTFHPIWSNFHYVAARSSMDGGRRNAQNEDNQQTDLLCHDNDDDGVHDDDSVDDGDYNGYGNDDYSW